MGRRAGWKARPPFAEVAETDKCERIAFVQSAAAPGVIFYLGQNQFRCDFSFISFGTSP